MGKIENTKNELQKLKIGTDHKSDIELLRSVFDDIESVLASGVRRKVVLETINNQFGLKMGFKTFEKNIHIIRKEIKSKNINNASNSVSVNTSVSKIETEQPPTKVGGFAQLAED